MYTLRQQGSKLTGTVEYGVGGFFGAGDKATPITDGKVEGNRVSFTAGISSYEGTLEDGELNLKRTLHLPWHLSEPEKPKGPQPAVGPPPDGSDPSRNPNWHLPKDIPTVLHRVNR